MLLKSIGRTGPEFLFVVLCCERSSLPACFCFSLGFFSSEWNEWSLFFASLTCVVNLRHVTPVFVFFFFPWVIHKMGIISPLKGCCEGKLDCPGKLLGMYENAFVSSLNFVALCLIFILIFFDLFIYF